MPITTPPPAPNRNQPSTFSARMDAFLGWLVSFVSELNGVLWVVGANGMATFAGNGNSMVLTAGYPALQVGMKIRFKATSTNTTAGCTINLDNRGARQCRTPRMTVPPIGFIRTGVFTEAVWDGTYWVLDRETEVVVNANGRAVKYADGTLICSHTAPGDPDGTTIALSSLFRSAAVVWTFPVPFSDVPCPHASVRPNRWAGWLNTIAESTSIYEFNYGTSSIRSVIFWSATGTWY